MAKAIVVVFSTSTDVVWKRSISELRSAAYRAKVDIDILQGMTRETLRELLEGSGLEVAYRGNDDQAAKRTVVAHARKAAKVHKVAAARERDAACGHRNCGDDCRWV